MPSFITHTFYDLPVQSTSTTGVVAVPPVSNVQLGQPTGAFFQDFEALEGLNVYDEANKEIAIPKDPRSEEEKEEIIRTLIRAKRMYLTYRREECQEGCLSFAEYASCFFFIREEDAVQFLLTGDIKV